MQRVDNGRPLREAMERANLSIPQLAAITKEIDPDGRGLSQSLIGFYTSSGSSGRERASERTAGLIVAALEAAGVDVQDGEIFADSS